MLTTKRRWIVMAPGLLPALLAASVVAQPSAPSTTTAGESIRPVSSVVGPSLLARLRSGFNGTSYGRVGLIGAVPAAVRQRSAAAASAETAPGDWLVRGFTVSGSDLYRINCRSCHGPGGGGLPPAISALGDPLRATSPALIAERMAQRGRTLSQEAAERMANRAELGIRHRLLEGGEVMPPFGHLSDHENDALLGYLEVLVGAPASNRTDLRLDLTAARIGEHVIKANCQICHDATESLAQRRPAADRDIPPLATIPERYSAWEFVRKVREGSPSASGTRGRMPRFTYLSREELAAAYLYLTAFPPQEKARP